MAVLGTRKFYKPFENGESEESNQILKNQGYVSIILHSAYYNSKGNFWTRAFGGIDKIALTSSVIYKSSDRTIEAKSIINKREVTANRNHTLGISRFVALQVPTTADGIELKIELVSVKEDNFENGLDLMNDDEFRKPLELAPIPIGQILSITSVLKKVFSGIDNPSVLEATYAGIIARDKSPNPVERERLTAGYIIAIANNDEDNTFISDVDPSKFTIEGDGLKYDDKLVEHTNLVYSIIFEKLKGIDEMSNWFKIYQNALEKLDEVVLAADIEAQKAILNDSKKLWIEASALLSEDSTYISKEKWQIKATYLNKIDERYTELTSSPSANFYKQLSEERSSNLDFLPEINRSSSDKAIKKEVHEVATTYLKDLGSAKLIFPE